MSERKSRKTAKPEKKTRTYLSQADVPACSLEQALRVPTAIAENYGGDPVTPLQLASGMMMTPTSGPFRSICGASIAYGFTDGGCKAKTITLQSLGRRVVTPLQDGDDLSAKREAILKPRILREFLTKYNGSALPRHDIALNVLVELGVPRGRTESVYTLILDSAENVGFVQEIKGKQYIDLKGATAPSVQSNGSSGIEDEDVPDDMPCLEEETPVSPSIKSVTSHETNRRVFITHGKNRDFIEPIKKLLGFGEMIPVISAEKQTVSKPVPDKVMHDMRSCGAAIIHVDAEQVLIDKDAKEHVTINPNVLMEVGAAMALYGRRFILLVRDSVRLPSNLQGLYEVRYKAETLDGETTIRLLEAINDIKNNPLPNRYSQSSDGG